MLSIQSLVSGYGTLAVLHDISLQIDAGEAVAIIGANGAGKTSLVRTIAGLNRPMNGTIVMNDVDLTGLPAHQRPGHGIATLLENRRLFGEFTIEENLRLAEDAGRKLRRDKTMFTWKNICALFPMIEERRGTCVELLSGGQQQMVAVARCLLLQPDLLVLDEPSTGLAPKVIKDILEVLGSLRGRGMAILLVEQNVGIAASLTERAYVMALGRIVHEVEGAEWRNFAGDERLAKAYLGGNAKSKNQGARADAFQQSQDANSQVKG
jgi:ABC-type branched-subunit amino acid transport system ATPase component